MRTETELLYQKLLDVIPGGVNSPVRACLAVRQMPLIAARGVQDELIDVDGTSYIDYCGSWGALIHGHAHPEIVEAIQKQLLLGTSYGVTTEIEERLARKTIELVPSIEQIRFVSSGTEATMSAVRLARGFTGRNIVIKFTGHYHGHADFLLVKAGSGLMHLNAESSSLGVPIEAVKHTLCLPFNDIEAIEQVFNDPKLSSDIACVILEPVAGNMGVVPASAEFLQILKEKTEKSGSLLIFDEVMTGFRVAKGGAQALYGITPDLTCLGKVIGGGLPAAAFGGRKEIMQKLAPVGGVYQAGTLSGNPLAMAAGLKALEILDRPGFYEELDRKTSLLVDPIQDYINEHQLDACLQRVGSMLTVFIGQRKVNNGEEAKLTNQNLFAEFFQMLFKKGIYIPPLQQEAWFVSMAHTDAHLKATADHVIEFLEQSVYDPVYA